MAAGNLKLFLQTEFLPVFNLLNWHPELAAGHWCSNGIGEGRQATSSFHTLQYLANYPDLQEAFGDNYTASIIHYINHGLAEGRVGGIVGGGYGRWTIRSDEKVDCSYIYLSTSERMAGAIDSLVWKDKEFINNFDHGRQLQVALSLRDYGECWNPNEAGSVNDGNGMETTSDLRDIQATRNRLNTTVHAAYWNRAGHRQDFDNGIYCTKGTLAYNSEDVHPYDIKKVVTLGCFSLNNCIQFDMTAEIGNSPDMPAYTGFAQFESPTAYLNSDFNKVTFLDAVTGCVESFEQANHAPGETDQLVIIHTEDEQHALGAVTRKRPPTSSGVPGTSYGYFDYGPSRYPNFDEHTYKWTVVTREDLKAGDVFEVTSYVCVGSLDMVIRCLTDVQTKL